MTLACAFKNSIDELITEKYTIDNHWKVSDDEYILEENLGAVTRRITIDRKLATIIMVNSVNDHSVVPTIFRGTCKPVSNAF
jgi:hypothetical protein